MQVVSLAQKIYLHSLIKDKTNNITFIYIYIYIETHGANNKPGTENYDNFTEKIMSENQKM